MLNDRARLACEAARHIGSAETWPPRGRDDATGAAAAIGRIGRLSFGCPFPGCRDRYGGRDDATGAAAAIGRIGRLSFGCPFPGCRDRYAGPRVAAEAQQAVKVPRVGFLANTRSPGT